MSRQKICHITTAHNWDDVRIFHKQCRSLSNYGYEVVLLSLRAQSGVHSGISVVGMGYNKLSRLKRFLFAPPVLLRTALHLDAEVYHLHDPELLLIAAKLKRRGKKVIYDAHEDLPRQIFTKHYLNPFLKRIVSALTGKILVAFSSKLSGVVAATDQISSFYYKHVSNVETIKNYPLTEELIVETDRVKTQSAVCYIGGIFPERGIFQMLDAVNLTSVTLHLAGNFSPESLLSIAQKHRAWEKVIYHGYLGREQIKVLLASSMAGLVVLNPIQSYIDSLPVKMFEYMASGIPVIASDFPLWKEIIEDNHCGICVNPLDAGAIAAAINYLDTNPDVANQMGGNGKKAVMEKYNWNAEERKLIEFYQNLLK